jgi:hypothetical protein
MHGVVLQIRVFRTAARRKLDQFIPIEIDFDQVRRQRQNGIRGLRQMLKSFRDRPVDFPVYPAKRSSRNSHPSIPLESRDALDQQCSRRPLRGVLRMRKLLTAINNLPHPKERTEAGIRNGHHFCSPLKSGGSFFHG